jgi:antitoxin VapB
MALNIKNPEVEQLASEVALLGGTSKTEAIRIALKESKEKALALLSDSGREERLLRFLESRVWPTIPPEASRTWSKDEEDAALGYGEWGEPVC